MIYYLAFLCTIAVICLMAIAKNVAEIHDMLDDEYDDGTREDTWSERKFREREVQRERRRVGDETGDNRVAYRPWKGPE